MIHNPGPAVAPKKSVQLIIRVRQTPDQHQIRQEIFGSFPVVVGRQVLNSFPVVVGPNGKFIILGDPKVSGNHIEIRRELDNFIVVDLNSTNGTIVDGGKLEKGGKVSFNKPILVQLGTNTSIELSPQR
jgi:pSer/pThr/pTyr-binding forkhead associated (FHA) protein